MIVVDASAVVDLLLRKSGWQSVSDRLFRRRDHLHAPHLLDAEVLQGLRRHYLTGALTTERGERAIERFRSMKVLRYSHLVILPRVWELRDKLTAYDACYIALAEFLDAPLITRDARLAASKGHQAKIELIS